ncbi:MAG: signal peptide peptidase SppA [Candidatus Aminicenantes bacterium]|nr:signal peptide peptidase SppA [Candidatus Aminicenantes bacterium]MDH5383778.1 signal peptide peptidase SppA [Candidatus Aminicenantes bacterium]MDH5744759.1 signal peptide peptidase SppA [Candidatus Aminicenantes bacterium]
MKKIGIWLILSPMISSACSPHFHLDFLGKERMEEVVLIKSRVKEKILLLDVSGLIGTSLNPGVLEREGDILSKVFYRLKKASEDKMVKGVILRLDTPGGEVTASDILYHEILNYKKRTGTPVLALMMGLAASGGYYIASACDYIIAHPSTLTGSIGVISIFPNLEELFDKVGIQVQIIKSGELKDSGSAFREMTDKERDVFQEIVDEFYQKFLNAVFEARKDSLSLENLRNIADGRVYTASQAYESKLIDEIGYFDSALKKVLELADVQEANVIAYTYYPKRKTNIYATHLNGYNPFESKSLQEIVQSLKSGFYYLWHPQLNN